MASKVNRKMLNFSDYKYVSDDGGHGTVLVPLSSLPGRHRAAPPDELSVSDLDGRSVTYELAGPSYYSNAATGARQFICWSFWESESTEDPDSPIVHLMVLSPGFDASDYR